MNLGFDAEEIALLKSEILEEGTNFVLVDDEADLDDSGEFAHFQFIGKNNGKEVIYDAMLTTLRLHHSGLLYEEAEKIVKKEYSKYKPIEEREDDYEIDEDAELFLEELIEQFEDNETYQVAEFIEVDNDFEYGIGIDASLNVSEITVEVIEKFIKDFNGNSLKLDSTLVTFKNEEDQD